MMESGALFLAKLQYYSCSVEFYYCSCRVIESLLIFQLIIIYQLTMLHVNEKFFNSHSQLWKDNFRQKKFERCDMTSANLEKTLKYFKIQENLRSEKLAKDYLHKIIFFYFFSTLKDIIQAQSKTKSLNQLEPYDYLLKTYFREMFFVQC